MPGICDTRHGAGQSALDTVPRRGRRRASLLATALVAVFVLAACTPEQQDIYDRVNATRAEHGLAQVWPHASAMAKAQAWAEHLAATDTLAHSRLSDGITGRWRRLSENVGRGPSIEAIHEMFLESEVHRHNILDPDVTFVGTGHAIGADGRHYVVQVFSQY